MFFIRETSVLHYIYVYRYLMIFLLYPVVGVIVNIFGLNKILCSTPKIIYKFTQSVSLVVYIDISQYFSRKCGNKFVFKSNWIESKLLVKMFFTGKLQCCTEASESYLWKFIITWGLTTSLDSFLCANASTEGSYTWPQWADHDPSNDLWPARYVLQIEFIFDHVNISTDSRGYSTFLYLKSVEISMEFRKYSISLLKNFSINFENKKITLIISKLYWLGVISEVKLFNLNIWQVIIFFCLNVQTRQFSGFFGFPNPLI